MRRRDVKPGSFSGRAPEEIFRLRHADEVVLREQFWFMRVGETVDNISAYAGLEIRGRRRGGSRSADRRYHPRRQASRDALPASRLTPHPGPTARPASPQAAHRHRVTAAGVTPSFHTVDIAHARYHISAPLHTALPFIAFARSHANGDARVTFTDHPDLAAAAPISPTPKPSPPSNYKPSSQRLTKAPSTDTNTVKSTTGDRPPSTNRCSTSGTAHQLPEADTLMAVQPDCQESGSSNP